MIHAIGYPEAPLHFVFYPYLHLVLRLIHTYPLPFSPLLPSSLPLGLANVL